MAPKKSKSGINKDDLKQEDILQAVVFADSFNTNFSPISDDRPRALFPVANSPLLEYTLEFLCAGGVQEIYVVCCHHADKIKEHLRQSRWSEKSSPCSVVPIVSESYLSMGDALRDIDAKNVIRSDFILIHGDVVSNINLQAIVAEHKQRKEKDKSSIMTMVFRQVPPGHMTRCSEDDVIIAIDNQSQNVVHFQKTNEHMNSKKFEFPVDVLTDHRDLQLRYDLLDANISICSSQVPQLFTDNFDYETRDNFVRGILINEEIMGNSIQMHVVTDAYAARISNLHMYDVVSMDILNRWTFPFVPDNCHRHNKDTISLCRHNVYQSNNITLARESKLEENVLLGSGSSIGSNTVISHCVIGRNCKIGNNVKIKGSYLWDNVTLEDNCTIDTAILCDNVTVYEGVTICAQCVLASQVCVGPNAVLTSGTIAVASLGDDFGDEIDASDGGGFDPVFGSKGRAFLFTSGDKDDSDDEEVTRPMWGLTIKSESTDDEDSDKSSESGSQPDSLPSDEPVYYTEMLDTVQRAKDENISNENLILEINSLKHAFNISIKELTCLVVRALIEQPLSENPSMSGVTAIKCLQQQLTKHLPVVQNYVRTTESQMHCLQAFQEFGFNSSENMSLVMKLVHFLYNSDILSETTIIKWYNQAPDTSTHGDGDSDEEMEDKHAELRKQMAPLVKWLEEADEESSEDD